MGGTFNVRQDTNACSDCLCTSKTKANLVKQGDWIARYSIATMAEPLKAPVDWTIGDNLLTEMFLHDLQSARGWFNGNHPGPEAGHVFDLFDGMGVTCSVQRTGAPLAQQNHTDREAAAAWMATKL